MIRATMAHADALAAIHGAAFPPNAAWGPDAIALQLGLPGVFGLLDPRGGMILARITGAEAEILTLAVVPASRRYGIALSLLSEAMHEAASRGADALFLEVSDGNGPARALYEGAGFRQVGRRHRYYPDGTDALILRADLSPCAAEGS
jgi:ribosomal-protein-alanine N-acetyltransferase